MRQYTQDFIAKARNAAEENGEPEPNIHDLLVMGRQYAKDEIARENKHLKAYIKGKKKYTHLRRTHQVMTPDNLVASAVANDEEE